MHLPAFGSFSEKQVGGFARILCLQKIEDLYGKADRIWVMDRGIPTEEVLQEMRKDGPDHPPVHYIVGTPKGRLTKYEKRFLEKDWEQVRPGVQVKHIEETGEQYVLTRSSNRVGKVRFSPEWDSSSRHNHRQPFVK